ncbi:hypothetical protein ASE67_09755 [Sphingomonas sp. Leaf23]|nr:hypothetical protein ASE67_09755 [Sphingomonas sp. Leaf23]
MMVWTGLLALAQATSTPVYFPPFYERLETYCPNFQRTFARFSDDRREWYSKHLRAAQEPSLFQQARAGRGDTLRFLWLRTNHAPVIVRIENMQAARGRLIATELTGQGGYAPGTIKRRLDRQLTAEETADLRRRLVANNPLGMASGTDECTNGMDGSQWIVERAVGQRYKMVDRFYPEQGPIRSTGMGMLRLTGWQFDRIY